MPSYSSCLCSSHSSHSSSSSSFDFLLYSLCRICFCIYFWATFKVLSFERYDSDDGTKYLLSCFYLLTTAFLLATKSLTKKIIISLGRVALELSPRKWSAYDLSYLSRPSGCVLLRYEYVDSKSLKVGALREAPSRSTRTVTRQPHLSSFQ